MPRGSLFFQRLVDCLEFNPICLCGKDFFFFNLIFFPEERPQLGIPHVGTEWMGIDDDEEEKSGVRRRACV